MPAYYNEIEPYAAQWLRNLIDAGHIAPGVVDTRSIEDAHPSDLREFTQCHFFAGIGVWSHALRSAGWSDDRPVWTGSCPCQPFSEAGAGAGFDDERHLWPHFYHLIKECQPAVVLGEQVSGKRAGPWIDLVQTDMEALGYAFGALPFPACSVGADHIRERTYWCANANKHHRGREASTANNKRSKTIGPPDWTSGYRSPPLGPRPSNDWVMCPDGRERPTEPGIPVLVDEYPGRVDQLRAFGNAIDAKAAQAFIQAVMECQP